MHSDSLEPFTPYEVKPKFFYRALHVFNLMTLTIFLAAVIWSFATDNDIPHFLLGFAFGYLFISLPLIGNVTWATLEKNGLRMKRTFFKSFYPYEEIVQVRETHLPNRGFKAKAIPLLQFRTKTLPQFSISFPCQLFEAQALEDFKTQLKHHTNCHWVMEPTPTDSQSIFTAVKTLKKASGATTNGAFFKWLLGHMFSVQAHILPQGSGLAQIIYGMLSLVGMVWMANLVLGHQFYQQKIPENLTILLFMAIGIAFLAMLHLCFNLLVHMVATEVQEREHAQQQIKAAAEVQRQLLPQSSPQLAPYEVAAVYVPAINVGGDYYDYIVLDKDRLAIVVADVSGKGLPAGLVMTMAKGMLHTALETSLDLATAMNTVNRHISGSTAKNTFISMVIAVIHRSSGKVELARAGHNPPLWFQASSKASSWLKPKGLALGVSDSKIFDAVLEVQQITLAEGDTLVLYSDGLTEAENAAHAEYGEQRLQAAVQKEPTARAAEIVSNIQADVDQFRANQAPNDDLTLVVLKRGESIKA